MAHVYCGQTAAWINVPLVTEVGLGPDDTVLHWDPAPSPKRRRRPVPIFGPCLLWPNSWMDQDGTWHGSGPWSSPHCARWGLSSCPQNGTEPPSIFGPFLLWPNGWMRQDATWYGGRPQPRRLLDGDPGPLPQKGAEPPIFGPCLLWPNGWMDEDATWYGSSPRPRPHFFTREEPNPPTKVAQQPPPLFSAYYLCPRSPISATVELL